MTCAGGAISFTATAQKRAITEPATTESRKKHEKGRGPFARRHAALAPRSATETTNRSGQGPSSCFQANPHTGSQAECDPRGYTSPTRPCVRDEPSSEPLDTCQTAVKRMTARDQGPSPEQ